MSYRVYFAGDTASALTALPADERTHVHVHLENVALLASGQTPADLRRRLPQREGHFSFETAGTRVLYDVNPDLRLVYVRRVSGRAAQRADLR